MNHLTPPTASSKDLFKVGMVANVFEWYEFTVYGFMASIIGQIFFDAKNSILALIYAFFLFSLGYFTRPLGSLFFGYLGDRYGRKKSLRLSITLMTIPTVFIGLLPTYQSIGFVAPLLLMLCRFVQGFAMGGELPGSACYVYEAANPKHRSLLCSTTVSSSAFGILLGSGITALLLLSFERETVLAWAWRIPFLLGIPITIVILLIRRTIIETVKPQSTDSLWKNLRNEKAMFAKSFILVVFLEVCVYALIVWMPSYLEKFLLLPTDVARLSNVTTILTFAIASLSAGYFTRFISLRKIVVCSMLATMVFIYPLFLWLQTASVISVFVIQILFALLMSGLNGLIMETVCGFFSNRVRCTGMGLSFTCAAAFFGGATPTLCTYVIYKTGYMMFPAVYIIFFGLIALPVALSLRKTI